MVLGFLERLERFYSIHTDAVDAGNSTGSGITGVYLMKIHFMGMHLIGAHFTGMSQACIS